MTRWMKVGPAELGAAAELIVAAEFTVSGYQVFRPLSDVRKAELLVDLGEGRHLMVRVKSVRGPNYVFVPKSSFPLDNHRALALVVFPEDADQPELFLIPARVWHELPPPFVAPDYAGLKSKPEYGIRLNSKWREQLATWRVRPGDPLPAAF
ncbi:hypothetical protein ACQP1K_25020 [Sphaerimonospora sp. CA-214678]|uniref:hypothetical protein n=1 Tax=Sphaerimonospora sp. CA-214678 TaxID=3240029 RepID=UPI003D8EB27E